MNGWSSLDITLNPGQVVGASATNSAITKEYSISAGGSVSCVLKITLSSVTVAAAITAKLQTAINNDWVDSKTATVSGNGSVYIKLNPMITDDADDFLPLLNKGRIVITTGVGDTATVDAVQLLQEL